jgi:hypothetical protein
MVGGVHVLLRKLSVVMATILSSYVITVSVRPTVLADWSEVLNGYEKDD